MKNWKSTNTQHFCAHKLTRESETLRPSGGLSINDETSTQLLFSYSSRTEKKLRGLRNATLIDDFLLPVLHATIRATHNHGLAWANNDQQHNHQFLRTRSSLLYGNELRRERSCKLETWLIFFFLQILILNSCFATIESSRVGSARTTLKIYQNQIIMIIVSIIIIITIKYILAVNLTQSIVIFWDFFLFVWRFFRLVEDQKMSKLKFLSIDSRLTLGHSYWITKKFWPTHNDRKSSVTMSWKAENGEGNLEFFHVATIFSVP